MMSLGFLYWLILILLLLFGTWRSRLPEGKFDFPGWGSSLVLWVLLAIIGYAVFGSPIHK